MSHDGLKNSQNFITDPILVERLLDLIHLSSHDLCYEIGPGKGIITLPLAQRCRRLIAFEKDPVLARQLTRDFREIQNLEIRQTDFLTVPLPKTPFKVVANLPFDQTAAMVSHLTDQESGLMEASLVVQKEAAQRYLGAEGETMRSILLKTFYEVSNLYDFKRSDFTPQPKVDAVFLNLRKIVDHSWDWNLRQFYRDFVVYGFMSSRTGLVDTLDTVFTWGQMKRLRKRGLIQLDSLPSQLSVQDWLALFEVFMREEVPGKVKVIGAERRWLKDQCKIEKIYRTRLDRNWRKDQRQ